MRKGTSILAAAALTFMTSAALAHVLDPANGDPDKSNAKLRADIGKQVAKYTFCLVKAASKCEAKGTTSGVECHLDTGVVDYDPGDATAKFAASIAKCDSKLALTKKGTDYVGIGCPGDCNTVAPGTQECADIPAFEATVKAVTPSSAKGQLGLLATGIDGACGVDTGAGPTDAARIDCVKAQVKLASKYGSAVFKCEGKCEVDFKDKKGNGGPSNGPDCLAGDGGADANFTACVNKTLSKIAPNLSPSLAGLPGVLNGVINSATAGLYDRFDPTSTPDASPCGNCGNATREGAEECDGADAAACPGLCATDCTCP
jgi:hypothetical protein